MKRTWLICLIAAVAVLAGVLGISAFNAEKVSSPTEQAGYETTEMQPFVTAVTEETEPNNEENRLPKLYLEGDLSEMWEKSDERVVAFTYDDGNQAAEGYVKIKIQGNFSTGFEKKNYTIKMYRDQGCEEKLKLDVGWGEENKYCLKANWIDKTHARNNVTARIASQVQEKYGVLPNTPNQGLIDGFPIEIYNNNAFLGLYTWNIPKDEWLLNMDGDNTDHIAVCGDSWADTTSFRDMPNFVDWELEVGEDNEETLSKLSRLFDFVINSTDEEFIKDIHNYLNLDSVLNYYLLADLACLSDNLGKNMLLFTYDSEIWYVGLYDLDTSWGTSFDGLVNYNGFSTDLGFPLCRNYLLQRIETCFGDALTERYFELREDIFTKEHIMNEFQSFRNQIPQDTFEREVIRWGNEIPGFDYDQIEEYVENGIPALDKKYSDLDRWVQGNEYRMATMAELFAADINDPAIEEFLRK